MSPSRTANPAPRRALRKADDAGIHPATTRPVPLVPVAGPAAPVSRDAVEEGHGTPTEPGTTPVGDSGNEKPKKRKGSSGRTDQDRSDRGGRPAGQDHPTADQRAGTTTKKSAAWDKRFHGNTSDVLRAQRTTNDLLLGAEGVMEVRVPKRLRKAARLEAESRGLTIDKVVTRLLADWIESP